MLPLGSSDICQSGNAVDPALPYIKLNCSLTRPVGIFSLFGKKDPPKKSSSDKSASRGKRESSREPGGSRQEASRNTRPVPTKRDAQAARATAMKIDAIESEMSSEFVKATTIQPQHTQPGPNTVSGKPAGKPAPPPKPALAQKTLPPLDFASTASQGLGTTTGFLLNGGTTIGDVAAPTAEAAAVIEEAAIMFANNQIDVVEQMLRAAIAEGKLGQATLNAWWMLFDLYQVTGRQQDFENLSLEYLNVFETSPPAWNPLGKEPAQAAPAGAVPLITFTGKLDANSAKLTERLQKLAESNRALRLEFNRVSEVDPAGCGLLLNALRKLQKSGHELVLVGARELAEKIHATLEIGRRDDTEDPWLLMLELLRLLNLEKEFEEASIDYCVTFEVSPPAFVAPQTRITTAASESSGPAGAEAGGFPMPAVIEGRIDQLILAIAAYSDEHDPAIVDCSRLMRVDFNAAGRLLTGLAPFCGSGKVIEFHNVNHLVAALFAVIGLKDIVRIHPRKY